MVEEISGSAFFDFAKKNLFDCTGKIYFKFRIFKSIGSIMRNKPFFKVHTYTLHIEFWN